MDWYAVFGDDADGYFDISVLANIHIFCSDPLIDVHIVNRYSFAVKMKLFVTKSQITSDEIKYNEVKFFQVLFWGILLEYFHFLPFLNSSPLHLFDNFRN